MAKGTCVLCERVYELRKDGLVRSHQAQVGRRACGGSGAPPKRALTAREESWSEQSEEGFLQMVRKLAKLAGWVSYHTRDSRRSDPGFPDLVLVHRARKLTLFWELKRIGEQPRPDQIAWIRTLQQAGQHARAVTPLDWDYIEEVLTGAGRKP